MSSATSTIQVSGLARDTLDTLHAQAEAAGVAPDVYARQLLEDGILLAQEAKTTSFAELVAPARKRFKKSKASEEELDFLVDGARTRHHERASRKKS